MMRTHKTGIGLIALIALTAACSDDAIGPEGPADLTAAERQFLAEESEELISGILGDEFASISASAASVSWDGAVAASIAPIVTEFTFNRTRPCRLGGQVVATGSGVRTADRETGVVEMTFEGTKSIEDCAHQRGDLVITLNGQGAFDGYRKKVNGEWEGLQTTNHSGFFSWITSDGREGECSFDLHSSYDPSTGILTITGEFCGAEVFKEREVDR